MSDSVCASPRPNPWHIDLDAAGAVTRQRAEFVRYLRANGRPDDDYAAAELIFGELVGNAYLHAPGPLEVSVEWSTGHAILHVTDRGGPIDVTAARMPDARSEHGRGLAIVRALAPAVHATTYPAFGKTISAALPVRPKRSSSFGSPVGLTPPPGRARSSAVAPYCLMTSNS